MKLHWGLVLSGCIVSKLLFVKFTASQVLRRMKCNCWLGVLTRQCAATVSYTFRMLQLQIFTGNFESLWLKQFLTSCSIISLKNNGCFNTEHKSLPHYLILYLRFNSLLGLITPYKLKDHFLKLFIHIKGSSCFTPLLCCVLFYMMC